MASFLVRSELSVGDLRLFLTNENGYPQDAVSVNWSIYDQSGARVSGDGIPAIKKKVGEYYAPWYSDVRNGNYSIRWSIQETQSSGLRVVENKSFVIDPSTYQVPGYMSRDGIPASGGFTYLTGSYLGQGDLPLYLKDDNGFLFDAHSVLWSIHDSKGRAVSGRSEAVHTTVGSYFAPFHVNLQSGSYSILWEFQKDALSPMNSVRMGFDIISPPNFTAFGIMSSSAGCRCVRPTLCDSSWFFPSTPQTLCYQNPLHSSCSDSCSNDSVEIPATMHLLTGTLPSSGAYTDQAPYQIPHCIRKISFYVTYQRGAPGGNASFKIMWGNGIGEYAETIIDYGDQSPLSFQTLTGPTPTDDNEIKFVIYMTIPGGCVSARLIAAEAGVPGSPGTCSIILTASSG